MAIYEDEILILEIERTWSNDYSIGIVGWCIGKKYPVNEMDISVGDISLNVASWHPRTDIISLYQQYNPNVNCGFVAQLPRVAEHQLSFTIKNSEFAYSKSILIQGMKNEIPSGFSSADGIYNHFIEMVNSKHLKVLEIGSRVVGNESRRSLFPGALLYTGFDYYKDANTDVIGDAHNLSSYFGSEKFDAIFSDSVLEHLAMPWVAALEINKLLKIGGITFQSVPCAWPLHERPWDFYRFSDEGLKVLFSKVLGFKVLKAGMSFPIRMHFDDLQPGQEQFPLAVSFGNAVILAEKISEIDSNKLRWDTTLSEILEPNSFYPK